MIDKILNKIIIRKDDLLLEISNTISNKLPNIYTYFGFHCLNEFYNNRIYSDLLSNNFSIYSADYGIYVLFKLLGFKRIENFNGTDFNKLVIDFIIRTNKKFFFIGGNFKLSNFGSIKNYLSGYQNGYFSDLEEVSIINCIKDSKSDVIIIGMGIPKQEYLAQKLFINGVDIPILCVGNFMEFYLGTVKRAPKFLRNSGFEWIYRILVEPKKLWKRYLLGIPRFVFHGTKLILNKF